MSAAVEILKRMDVTELRVHIEQELGPDVGSDFVVLALAHRTRLAHAPMFTTAELAQSYIYLVINGFEPDFLMEEGGRVQ
jgi:hypothetical protein